MTTEAGERLLNIIYAMDPQGLYPPDPAEMVAAIEQEAAQRERDRIIEVIANVPVTIKFKEPVTSIDLLTYHADIIRAIER